jgi:ComF family protein
MLKNLLSLFLKPNCPLCQRPAEQIVCKYCSRQLKSCQLDDCTQFWQGDLPVFVWGVYGSYLKRAIASLKYDLHQDIAELLGIWLAQAWLNCPLSSRYEKLVVVPIPIHQVKLKERGFNQAELIARRFCQVTGYTLKANLLQRIRNTEVMFGLNPTQRQKNIAQAFALGTDYHRFNSMVPVLILDDIYTTGTTVREASQVLRTHGVKVIGVVAVASPKGR